MPAGAGSLIGDRVWEAGRACSDRRPSQLNA